jgi:hypothetical protein
MIEGVMNEESPFVGITVKRREAPPPPKKPKKDEKEKESLSDFAKGRFKKHFTGLNIELEEMSSMGGGSVEGFAGPARKEGDEKTIIREDEIEVIEEVMNYLLSKMEIL